MYFSIFFLGLKNVNVTNKGTLSNVYLCIFIPAHYNTSVSPSFMFNNLSYTKLHFWWSVCPWFYRSCNAISQFTSRSFNDKASRHWRKKMTIYCKLSVWHILFVWGFTLISTLFWSYLGGVLLSKYQLIQTFHYYSSYASVAKFSNLTLTFNVYEWQKTDRLSAPKMLSLNYNNSVSLDNKQITLHYVKIS